MALTGLKPTSIMWDDLYIDNREKEVYNMSYTINKAANGFIVYNNSKKSKNIWGVEGMASNSDMPNVFNTEAALFKYLSKQFEGKE